MSGARFQVPGLTSNTVVCTAATSSASGITVATPMSGNLKPLTLSQYPNLEGIPKYWQEWHPSIRRARVLSESLFNGWNDAVLFRTLATLRLDVPVFDTVEDLRWKGPGLNFEEHCRRLKFPDLLRRVTLARPRPPQNH